jgi:predicted lactoylglutathione lyase
MPIYPGVSMIRLSVGDLVRARAFYERLGWRLSTTMSSGDFACFALNNIALTLEARPLHGAADIPALTLIQCHGGPRSVEVALGQALSAGATLIENCRPTPAGGFSARFADLEGHVWELACDPRLELGHDGAVSPPP